MCGFYSHPMVMDVMDAVYGKSENVNLICASIVPRRDMVIKVVRTGS